jgi:hypothetical protein
LLLRPIWCELYFVIFFSITTTSLIDILWSGESLEQSKPTSNIAEIKKLVQIAGRGGSILL